MFIADLFKLQCQLEAENWLLRHQLAIALRRARPRSRLRLRIARQITEAFPWDDAPQYLIRDRDRIYGTFFTRQLRAMGIRDKPTAPASPWQNGLPNG
jgi:hypothetical protein